MSKIIGIQGFNNESTPVKMIMVHEDGTQKEYTKGFIAVGEEIKEGDTVKKVKLLGCNISGPDLMDMAWGIAAPIAEAAIRDDEEEE